MVRTGDLWVGKPALNQLSLLALTRNYTATISVIYLPQKHFKKIAASLPSVHLISFPGSSPRAHVFTLGKLIKSTLSWLALRAISTLAVNSK